MTLIPVNNNKANNVAITRNCNNNELLDSISVAESDANNDDDDTSPTVVDAGEYSPVSQNAVPRHSISVPFPSSVVPFTSTLPSEPYHHPTTTSSSSSTRDYAQHTNSHNHHSAIDDCRDLPPSPTPEAVADHPQQQQKQQQQQATSFTAVVEITDLEGGQRKQLPTQQQSQASQQSTLPVQHPLPIDATTSMMTAAPNNDSLAQMGGGGASVMGGSGRIIGRNKVFCGGRCLAGSELQMAVVTLVMITVPSVLFDVVTIQWFIVTKGLGTALGLLFSGLVLQSLCLVSYFSTVCADPGIIPRERDPLNSFDVNVAAFRDHGPPKHHDVVINGYLFKLKYCSTCNVYRAPRTVHCSVCDNCVERFDHHCPWVGNCIGKRNYRRFYFFIFSTSLLVIFVFVVTLVKNIIVIASLSSSEGSIAAAFTAMWPDAWESMILSIFTFAILWFVAGLWGYHTYLIWENQTTYEHIKSSYEGEVNPWDRGGFDNAREILCTRARPRYFDTRNLNCRPTVFEPTDIETNPPVVIKRNWTSTAANTPQQQQQQQCSSRPDRYAIIQPPPTTDDNNNRALLCGVEICSVADIDEATTSESLPSRSGQLQVEAVSDLPSPSSGNASNAERKELVDSLSILE